MVPHLAERSIATTCFLCNTTVELTVSVCFWGTVALGQSATLSDRSFPREPRQHPQCDLDADLTWWRQARVSLLPMNWAGEGFQQYFAPAERGYAKKSL